VAVTTLEDSIARTTAYEKAGADAICLVGVKDFQHLEALTAHLSLPIMLINYGNPALSDVDKLSAANVKIVVNGHAPYKEHNRLRVQPVDATAATHPKGSTHGLGSSIRRIAFSKHLFEVTAFLGSGQHARGLGI